MNQARLTLLADLPGTQIKRQGVFNVDDTLLVHFGDHFAQIVCLFDSTQGAYMCALMSGHIW
ncbi:MAG TPA: hypothetical protein VII92_18425 [Anaerolineae bacterium]